MSEDIETTETMNKSMTYPNSKGLFDSANSLIVESEAFLQSEFHDQTNDFCSALLPGSNAYDASEFNVTEIMAISSIMAKRTAFIEPSHDHNESKRNFLSGDWAEFRHSNSLMESAIIYPSDSHVESLVFSSRSMSTVLSSAASNAIRGGLLAAIIVCSILALIAVVIFCSHRIFVRDRDDVVDASGSERGHFEFEETQWSTETNPVTEASLCDGVCTLEEVLDEAALSIFGGQIFDDESLPNAESEFL